MPKIADFNFKKNLKNNGVLKEKSQTPFFRTISEDHFPRQNVGVDADALTNKLKL